jgi:hypothetical protein
MLGLGKNGQWGVRVEPGDVLLFSRRCSSMDMLSASICLGAKLGTFSPWDHVGIVTRNGEGVLEIVEANLGGITRRPLEQRLLRTRADKVAIRKISGPKPEGFDERLDGVIERYLSKSYNSSFLDMSRAWFHSYSYMYYGECLLPDTSPSLPPASLSTSPGCNSYNSLVSSKEHELSHLDHEASLQRDQHSPLLQYLLRLRISQLTREIRELQDSYREPCTPSSSPLAPNAQFDQYFCSQLLSSILTDMDLLTPQRTQHAHVPSEYSSSASSSGIHLKPPYHFSPDLVFRPRGLLPLSSLLPFPCNGWIP